MGARLNGKSVFERELSAWINQPEKTLKFDWEPGVQDIPERYENE